MDDDESKVGKEFFGYKVLGKVSELSAIAKQRKVGAVIAMQNVDCREKIVKELSDFDEWETLIHPSVSVSERSQVGKGCILCAGTNISVDTRIGRHCLFNISATIGHDCEIGDFVSVMSGANVCGHVVIDNKAYLATGSVVVPKMKIGEHAVVGAGSVAIRNVKPNSTVMGVPAKLVRF